MKTVEERGLVLLGCGKMGSAMLRGWLDGGLSASSVWVLDPNPSDWLQDQGVNLNADLPENPAVCILAVKPQMMGAALPSLAALGNGSTLFVSIAAGTTIEVLEDILGLQTPIVRAMPNTPAAVGKGITAMVGNSVVQDADLDLCGNLLQVVGQTVRLDREAQIDAVTGVSGSGPAYVFHMIEALAAAAISQGLPEDLAMKLAKATVAGSGVLAEQSKESVSQLRINVTSPNGTTAAGLDVLMSELPSLMSRTVKAATERSKELGKA